jgi:uncharacterized protein YoxC
MAIEFISFESVKVDGINAGSFSDCVANYSARRVELAAACKTFHADLVAAHKSALDAKEAELMTANASVATLTSETTTQSATIAELQADVATKASQMDTAAEAIAVYSREIVELQTQVEALKQNQRFDPRKINAKAFYARITKDEFALLAASPDPQLTAIAQAILAYSANEKTWPVEFDSVEMQGMIGYLEQSEFLSPDRAKQLTTDATWQEAFYAS